MSALSGHARIGRYADPVSPPRRRGYLVAAGKVEHGLFHHYNVMKNPIFCQVGRGEPKEIPAFDKANFVISRDDSYSRAPTVPERSRIVEVTVHNILQQDMREIVYVLLWFSPTF